MKWIAIKDQLPPVGKRLWLWAGLIYNGIFYGGRMFLTEGIMASAPTHWAEITPPESEETK